MSQRKTNWAIKHFSPGRHSIEESIDLKKSSANQQKEIKREVSMKLRTKQPSPAARNLPSASLPRHSKKDLSSFTFIYSHDLQEPLRKIQTFSSRILEQEENNLSENGKECFKRMQLAAHRMQMLIDDLVIYNKVNASKKTKKITTIHSVLEQVKNDLQSEIIEKKAIIEYTGKEEFVRVIPYQFYLLLNNLISNSLKFAVPSRQTVITLSTEIIPASKTRTGKSSSKKYLHLRLADNGIGFEEKFSERIFEVFQRLHAKDEYEGTGIGLAICKKIVENHKGLISAHGVPGSGAIFDIYLPAK